MEALRTFENLPDAEKIKFFEALTKPKSGSQQDASTSSTPSLEQTSACSAVPNLATFIEQLAKQTISASENPVASSPESKAKQKTLDGWLIKKGSSKSQPNAKADRSETVSPVTSKKTTTDTQTGENHTDKSAELVPAKNTDQSAGPISQSRNKALRDDSIEVPKTGFLEKLSLSASPKKNELSNSSKELKQRGIKNICELGEKSSKNCAPKKPKKADVFVNSPSSFIASSKTVSEVSRSSNHLDSLSNNNASGQACLIVNPSIKNQSISPKVAKLPNNTNQKVANDRPSSDLISCSSYNDISFNGDLSLKQISSKKQDSLLSSPGLTTTKSKKDRKLKKVISDNNIVDQDLLSKSVDDSLNYNSKSYIDESTSEDHDLNAGKKVKRKSFSCVSDILNLPENKKSESIKKAKSLPNVTSINYNLSSDEVSKLELNDKSLNKKYKVDINQGLKWKPKQSSKSKGVLKDDHLAKDSPKKQISKVSNKPLKTPPKRSIDGKSKTDASVSFDLSSTLSPDIVKSYSTIENVKNSVASGQYFNEANLSHQNKSTSSKKTTHNCTSKTDIPSADDNINSSCIPESSCDKLRSALSGSTVNDPNRTNEKEETVKITKADRKSKSAKISPAIPAPTAFSPFELLGLQQKSEADETESCKEGSIATTVTQKEMVPTNKRIQLGVKPKVLSNAPYFQESPPKQHSKTLTLNSPPNDIVSEPNIDQFTTSPQNKKLYNLRGKRKFAKKVPDSIETEGTACKKPRKAAGAKRIISDRSARLQERISSKDIAKDYDTFSSEESDYQVFIRISNLCSEHGLNIHDLLACKGVQNFLSQSTVDDDLENAVFLISRHVSNDGQMIPVVNMHSDRLILTEKLLELLNSQKS